MGGRRIRRASRGNSERFNGECIHAGTESENDSGLAMKKLEKGEKVKAKNPKYKLKDLVEGDRIVVQVKPMKVSVVCTSSGADDYFSFRDDNGNNSRLYPRDIKSFRILNKRVVIDAENVTDYTISFRDGYLQMGCETFSAKVSRDIFQFAEKFVAKKTKPGDALETSTSGGSYFVMRASDPTTDDDNYGDGSYLYFSLGGGGWHYSRNDISKMLASAKKQGVTWSGKKRR